MIRSMRKDETLSVGRLARAFGEPRSTVGRWTQARVVDAVGNGKRHCPVSGDPSLREKVRRLCHEPRHERYGYRRIWALLKRVWGVSVNRKTVWRIMHDLGLVREKIWRRPMRPKRVEKMRPTAPNQGWQIDMTSFPLSDLTPVFLVVIKDCFTREIVGWTLDRRCRASEWTAAVRMAMDKRGFSEKSDCAGLTLRSDNGAQPCSKAFVEALGRFGIRGQYTGYDAPDDNAYVERVIRTIKEEEVWLNEYDSFFEAHGAIEAYLKYYNENRPHSSLGYKTPSEIAAETLTQKAA